MIVPLLGATASNNVEVKFHPAALLLVWFAYAVGMQSLDKFPLLILALIVTLCAAKLAATRYFLLVKRARWLLISLGVIYLLATPGEYLPGILGEFGITFEGGVQGGIQIMRIVALVGGLSLLHHFLQTQGMLTGLYWMVSRYSWGRTTVVRLMLVLQYIEGDSKASWSDWTKLKPRPDESNNMERFSIAQTPFRWIDQGLVVIVFVVLAAIVN